MHRGVTDRSPQHIMILVLSCAQLTDRRREVGWWVVESKNKYKDTLVLCLCRNLLAEFIFPHGVKTSKDFISGEVIFHIYI